VPILATSSPRLDDEPPLACGSGWVVAPGNDFVCEVQQLCAGAASLGTSFDIITVLSYFRVQALL
jgi:hypothetical protein